MMTTTEVLESHIGICKLLADRYAWRNPVHDFDDLFQEAQLAVWQEALKRPGDDLKKLAGTAVQRRLARVTEETRSAHKPKHLDYIDALKDAAHAKGGVGDMSLPPYLEEAIGLAPSAEDEAADAMKREQVRNAVSALLPRQRAAAEDYMHEVPIGVTADRTGRGKRTIQTDRKAAFETLRVLLEEDPRDA